MHERVVFSLLGLALSESRFPDLLETLVVEVIERVGGDESGALQAGGLLQSDWNAVGNLYLNRLGYSPLGGE